MLSTLEATKSLIETAQFEAQRLQGVLSGFKAANEAGLRFLATARKTDHRPDLNINRISSPEIWREKADMACALAEEVQDPVSKRILLEIAKNYDELAE